MLLGCGASSNLSVRNSRELLGVLDSLARNLLSKIKIIVPLGNIWIAGVKP